MQIRVYKLSCLLVWGKIGSCASCHSPGKTEEWCVREVHFRIYNGHVGLVQCVTSHIISDICRAVEYW